MPPGSVQLVSTVGLTGRSSTSTGAEEVDGFGKVLISEMGMAGLRIDGLERKVDERTAGCTLSLGMKGDLNDGVADMSIIESLTPETVSADLIMIIPSSA